MVINLNNVPDHIVEKLVEWSEEAAAAEAQQR